MGCRLEGALVVFKPDWEAQFVEYFSLRAQPLRRLAYTLCGEWYW
jgi:hypothetical protein